MKLNPREQAVLDIIIKDIENSDKPYSTLSNIDLGMKLHISPNITRDKVRNLVLKGALQRVEDFWTPEGKYYNRVLYKGK
jgi:hypothetical protein